MTGLVVIPLVLAIAALLVAALLLGGNEIERYRRDRDWRECERRRQARERLSRGPRSLP